jgi:Sugar-tranasporters, 12 TM
MTNFLFWFSLALCGNVAITFRASEAYSKYQRGQSLASSIASIFQLSSSTDPETIEWHALMKKYLMVYLLAAFSDWLQGPYVYALYADYGYSQHDIALLFVAGFGSSMVFGSFVGSMADWGGRKLFVLLFAVLYGMSCMTKRKYTMCYICSVCHTTM